MKTISQTVAGLDVSKHSVDACIIANGLASTIAGADMAALALDLRRRGVELAVLEPTGGYERPVIAALEDDGDADCC